MAKAKGNKKKSSTSTTEAPTTLSVLAFDGIDDRIELSQGFPSIEKAITIEFWAEGRNSLGQQTSVIEAKNAQNVRVLNIHFPWRHSADSRIFWDAGNDNGFDRIDKAVKLEEYSVFTHWAFVKDADTGKLSIYRDGEVWHQGNGHHKSLTGIAKFTIGSFVDASNYWKGLLVEFRIWNQARTQVEIQENKNSRLTGAEAGLVGYWSLDEGSGTTVADKTNNANHGTIHGNPIWELSTLSLDETTSSQDETIDPAVTLTTGSKIKLKSWKGDYLHRPDSAQGVTTWSTGIGNEWTVEAILSETADPSADQKIRLKSCKGDYLHRPDSAQGVTTWSTGIGNEWTVEAIFSETADPNADNKIKLKSWKGDYLHRPDSPPDVTTWNTGIGNEWELEVISVLEPLITEGVPAVSASASPNVAPDPSTVPPKELVELIHPVPNEQSREPGEAASASPNVTPLPPQPALESSPPVTPAPAIAQPIPPVKLQGRQKVLVFDANQPAISVGSGALRPQGTFTIEAWIHPATDAGKQVIYAEGETLFYLEGGELKFQTPLSSEAIASAGAGITSGSWYHVAVTRAGSRPGKTKLYINGVQNDNQAAISPILSFGNTYLGGQLDVPDSRFQGKLLEVRVWRFARSQAEIQANMTFFLTGRELGLVRCWTLQESCGSAIGDRTTNRAGGSVTGDLTWEESEIPIKINLNAEERLTRSTGLEDYGYWFREMAKQQQTEADRPFRRGRIWA